MAVEFVINRIKTLFGLLLSLFRKALCCLRRRRRSSCDSIPLSTIDIGSNVMNNSSELQSWNQWEDNLVVVVSDKPSNPIQAKIDQYRQKNANTTDSLDEEIQPNYFEDMTPKITKQKKLLIKNKNMVNASQSTERFAVATEPIPTNELGEWEDNTAGWEEETVEEFGDPTKVLREQRRRERELRLFEQQQRKSDRHFRPHPLGAKLGS